MVNWLNRLNPIQVLTLGYLALVGVGASFLLLPFARTEKVPFSIVDSVFMATSAMTTTGLVTFNPGDFTWFGQAVMLVLMQVAGISYMTFISLLILGAGRRLSFSGRMIARESLGRPSSVDLLKFFRIVLRYTVIIEGLGAVVLALLFLQREPWDRAIWSAIFHSVSAFCTAGLSIYSDNMAAWRYDFGVNFVLSSVAALGAIGFFVMYDVRHWFPLFMRRVRPRRISVHSRLVLTVTLALYVVGTALVYAIDFHGMGERGGVMAAAFHVISASTTTGFSTVNVGSLEPGSIFVLLLLMFIGGSPGSTAGGIKTSTFGIMLLFLPAVLWSRQEINLFRRRVTPPQINKAFALSFATIIWLAAATVILGFTEKEHPLDLLFEAAAAMSTAGLSTGLTPELTDFGKILITLTMFIGRVGTLTIGFSLIGKPKAAMYKYPEADVLIG